jgi:hypothetical protein
MKLKDSLILWNPVPNGPKNSGMEVAVFINGSRLYESRDYRYSGGGCYTITESLTPAEARAYVFRDSMKLIIRDHMNPQAVHDAFCEIREYRDGLSEDTPVPDHLKDKFWRENNAN